MKKVMAIHDISGFGKCSLTVALPVLSACKIQTTCLPTAVLSTHTAIPGFTYKDLTKDISAFHRHWKSLNLTFDAMYSGFLGSKEQISMIADIFKTFKTKQNLILVDPVMADNGKMYSIFDAHFAKEMTKLCKNADIIVPNMTEAAFLLEQSYRNGPYDKTYIEKMLRDLSNELNVKKVVLTGVHFDNVSLGAAAYDKETDAVVYGFSKKIDGYFHGTGDLFGSCLLAAILNDNSLQKSIQFACDFVKESIERTVRDKTNINYGVNFEEGLSQFCRRITGEEEYEIE